MEDAPCAWCAPELCEDDSHRICNACAMQFFGVNLDAEKAKYQAEEEKTEIAA